MGSVKNYLSLIKFSHTVFALPFAIIGFLLGVVYTDTDLNWKLFGLVILCMIFARNAAMGFNRYIDRKIDQANPRTISREIPAGIVSPKSALFFVILNCVLFIGTTYLINSACFYLSPVALIVILGYSLSKRYTYLCHIILGLGLALAPIGAYIAVSEQFDIIPIIFSFIVLFWVSGFDIIYALQDKGFDEGQKLKSIPVKLGLKNSLVLSTALHVFVAILVVIAGIYANFGIYYWIGSATFISLLAYQHFIVKADDLSKVTIAFFTLNGIGSILFACFFSLDLLISGIL
ncbi:MAG: UbiA family prenyltransferase [Flavobacteriales bacterium]|nr:UbiA family prenyltransferase [Flavobacteriales bacterium]